MKPIAYAFYDLPANCFPFTVEIYAMEANPSSDAPLDVQHVDRPGVMEIQGQGRPTRVRVHYATGEVAIHPPLEEVPV